MSKDKDKAIKHWLKQLAKTGGKWQRYAKIAAALQSLMTVLQAWLLAQLLHQVIIEHHSAGQLGHLFLLAALITLLRYFAVWSKDILAAKASYQVQQQLRSTLIDKLYELGPAWRSSKRGGELVSQLQEQVAALDGNLAKYLPQMGLVMTMPILIIAAISPLSWAATVIFLLTAPLIPVFMIMVGYKAKDKQSEQQQQLARMSGHFLDQLRGLTTLQLFNHHHQQLTVIVQVADTFRQTTMSVLRIAFLSSAVLEFFASISIALVAVYLGFSFLGYFNFGLYGQRLTLKTAFFILLLAPEFYLPLRDLGTFYHAKAEALAAAEQLMSWLTSPSTQLTGGEEVPPDGAVELVFKDLTFSYPKHHQTLANQPLLPSNETLLGQTLLRQANLRIAAGKTTALIGQSGAGKTTVLRLLLGQLQAQSGEILIDAMPLSHLDIHRFREKIGWMSQHPHLIAASLRDNLLLANPSASDEDMIVALRQVELYPWFAQLPQQLDTRLGEDGRALSGGQLRRLALARVAISNANILLFDEPTASLDEDLEKQLLNPMRSLCRGKTVLLLTHRQAPLTLADTIVCIKDGDFHQVTQRAMREKR